ncbi:gamma-carotene 1'-hydroxylase CruF [Dapis sp. BLCC M229]|uniref:gamma-carotene 1'-hydroxylase CruF n=1 Tax=Dapis sp. BLCC M229 TaxID=3400188 RepID=UPI003CE92264
MKQLTIAERYLLLAHILSTVFGLAGLLIVLPNPEIIVSLPPIGQTAFQWSMAGGGATYIIFGALAVSLYGIRNLGIGTTLAFMLPSVFLSLSSELLGTSTGFPFGDYAYLSGLGYKIAGLVPFTIPLSWFYMGFVCYLLARCGLQVKSSSSWLRHAGAIATGAILLTAWDLVLDPAMSQAPFPFWVFQDEGSFFGMPYRNLVGWVGTGAIYITVAALLWRKKTILLSRQQLNLPLITYLVNFAFGATITLVALDSRFLLPTGLSVILGVVPAIILWWISEANKLRQMDMSIENVVTGNREKLPEKQVNLAIK